MVLITWEGYKHMYVGVHIYVGILIRNTVTSFLSTVTCYYFNLIGKVVGLILNETIKTSLIRRYVSVALFNLISFYLVLLRIFIYYDMT